MSKISGFITCTILTISCVLFCDAHPEDETRIKNSLIQDIVQKVCNLSLTAFANTPAKEKAKLLVKIEDKLNKSAKSLGSKSNKYVKLIMKGVRLKAFSDNKKTTIVNNNNLEANKHEINNDNAETSVNNNNDQTSDSNNDKTPDNDNDKSPDNNNNDETPNNNDKEPSLPDAENRVSLGSNVADQNPLDKDILSRNPDINTSKPETGAATDITKERLVGEIASKIETLAKTLLRDAKTNDAQHKVIEMIKHRFEKKADRKRTQLRNGNDEIKSYIDLLSKGVQLMIQKNSKYNTRKMEIVLNKDININKHPKEDNRIEDWQPKNEVLLNNELGQGFTNGDMQKPKSVVFKLDYNPDYKTESLCDTEIKDTCTKIKLLNSFKCENDKKVLHISKICDGKPDCSDFSDEINCARQAVECVQNAGRVMSHIDSSISHDCYETVLDKGVLSKQNVVLRNVLQKQLHFIQRHTVMSPETYSRRVFDADTPALRNTVNDVTNVVSTLTAALETAVCNVKIGDISRKQGSKIHKEKPTEISIPATWSPALCECDGKKCKKICTQECENICWQSFSLAQWQCQAIDGERSVPLDMVCDGKLDCYDETDENSCSEERSLAKYEATEMYNYILQLIMAKTSMKQYEKIRNNLLTLHDLVVKLQKLSLKRYTDAEEVKRIRETCFSEMVLIYNNALKYVSTPIEIMEIYIFLLSLNEKLVSAMKRSHTGNERILSNEGCICRDQKCALPRCSKSCVLACTVEPKLTRYFCRGSVNNSVLVEALCNGKQNCPNGDDEENCKEEVCRNHHLVLLRLSLRDAGERYKGTTLGEALILWKTKVTALIMVTENEGRPTPAAIQDLVQVILQDLVLSYASIVDYRRSSKTLDEYLKWSLVVMEAVRSCGH